MSIHDWAQRHRVPQQAMSELLDILDPTRIHVAGGCDSEAAVQAALRVEGGKRGVPLWRNNNGATFDQDNRMIRYGLGNDSKKINDKFKSSDLIGIMPQRITGADVGSVWGRFLAIEVKAPGWRHPKNDRERAQQNFLSHVRAMGGIGGFAQSVGDVFK